MKIYTSTLSLSDTQLLRKYAGKDVWVQATSWRFLPPYELGDYFIKPITIQGGILFYNRCLTDFDYRTSPNRQQYLTHQYTIPVEDVDIVRPVNVLTTDELLDLYAGGTL